MLLQQSTHFVATVSDGSHEFVSFVVFPWLPVVKHMLLYSMLYYSLLLYKSWLVATDLIMAKILSIWRITPTNQFILIVWIFKNLLICIGESYSRFRYFHFNTYMLFSESLVLYTFTLFICLFVIWRNGVHFTNLHSGHIGIHLMDSSTIE